MELVEEAVKPASSARVLTLGHVGRGTGALEPFDQVYPHSMLVTSQDIADGAEIDALVIWGGEDISPSYYNEKAAKHGSYAPDSPSRRDVIEASACRTAIDRGIPIIGVCRGAQLVCALAGGSLIQHVDNHGRTHDMMTKDGYVFATSSVHHQMQYPYDVEHELIAWAHPNRSSIYITEASDNDPKMVGKKEAEIVWYPKIKALGIQGHPEFHSNPRRDPFVQYCMKLVREYIL